MNESVSALRERPLSPRIIILVSLASVGLPIAAAKIDPMLAVVAAAATCIGLLAIRLPAIATAVVVFVLYSNAAVVAVNFHGVPAAVAGAYPLLLGIPLLDAILVRKERLRFDPILVGLTCFLAVQVLGAAFSTDPATSFGHVQGFFLEAVLLYFLVVHSVRTPDELRLASWALLAAAAVVGFFPLLQQLTGTFDSNYGGFGQQVEQASFSTTSGSQLRLCGSIGEINRYSQNLLMAVAIGWWLVQGVRRPIGRLAGLALTGVASLGFALAFSRGNAVAAALTIGMLVVMRAITVAQLAKVCLAGVLVLAVFPQYWTRIATISSLSGLAGGPVSSADAPDGSFRRRAEVMVGAGLMYLDHPVVGVGPGMSKLHSREYANQLGLKKVREDRQAHNLILGMAAETGSLGLLCFLGIVGYALVKLAEMRRRLLRRRPELSLLATGYLAAILAYLTSGLFLHMAYLRFFFLILALAGATIVIGRRLEESDAALPRETAPTA